MCRLVMRRKKILHRIAAYESSMMSYLAQARAHEGRESEFKDEVKKVKDMRMSELEAVVLFE